MQLMFSVGKRKIREKKYLKKRIDILVEKMNQLTPISSLQKKSLMLLKFNFFLFSFSMAQFGFADIILGCASCDCNQNGSIGAFCDTHTGQCPCKLGVEGLKCDSCADEFYGHSNGCKGNLLNIIHVNNSDW